MYYKNNTTVSSNLAQAKNKFETQLFKVSVPYLATLSEAEMQMYGVYQSGVKEIDRDLYNQMTNVYIPTKDILEYFKDGVTIRLCYSSDIKDIYLTIQEYLEAWRLMLQKGVNLSEAPSDDLLELDKLATEIFSRAKYYFGSTETESVLASYLNNLGTVNNQNFFNKTINTVIGSSSGVDSSRNGVTTINPIDDVENIERDSLTDFFKQRMYSTRFTR